MLFNHAHDLMSGVMTDRVYEDTIRGYDFSQRIADDEVQSRLRAASAAIDTQGEGIPVAVWNMLGWPRTDLAVVQVGFSDGGITDVGLVGPDGQAVPVQLLQSDAVRQRRPAAGRGCLRGPRCPGAGILRLPPAAAADAGRLDRSAAGRAGPGERVLPPRIRSGLGRHDASPGEIPGVERAGRSRQRRGPGRGSRRSVGAVSQPGRRLRHQQDSPPGAAAGQGRLQQRIQPALAARSAAARCSRNSRWHIPSAARTSFATTVRSGGGTAEDRHPHSDSQQREVRPLSGVVPDVDPRRPDRTTRFRLGPSSARQGSSFPPRTGSIMAAASKAWRCSIAACPATTWPRER